MARRRGGDKGVRVPNNLTFLGQGCPRKLPEVVDSYRAMGTAVYFVVSP